MAHDVSLEVMFILFPKALPRYERQELGGLDHHRLKLATPIGINQDDIQGPSHSLLHHRLLPPFKSRRSPRPACVGIEISAFSTTDTAD